MYLCLVICYKYLEFSSTSSLAEVVRGRSAIPGSRLNLQDAVDVYSAAHTTVLIHIPPPGEINTIFPDTRILVVSSGLLVNKKPDIGHGSRW